MILPNQTYEVIPLPDSTVVIRVFVPTMVTIGPHCTNDGRALVMIKTYPNINQAVNDLKLLIAAPPITV